MDKIIVACLQVALQKEVEEGPGVVIVEGGEIGYVKECDISPPTFPFAFQEKMLQMVREDNREHIFVIHKVDLNLHVSKIIRPPPILTV